MNLLIVDDSILTRKAMSRILEMVDLPIDTVFEAGNGEEALAILGNHTIDLILADLNMPGMGGIELIAQMQKIESQQMIPVIIISTEASTTRINQLLSQGASYYLHKPFTPETVRNAIEKTLGVIQS